MYPQIQEASVFPIFFLKSKKCMHLFNRLSIESTVYAENTVVQQIKAHTQTL